MSTYMKQFIYASLFYLAAATILGALTGALSLGYWAQYGHTHLNLLGFMAMMVFGIGYFVLPRFNGADLRWPGLVALHFWLGNISLIGMVIFRGLAVDTGNDTYQGLFIASASIQSISILMFVVNLWVTLAAKKPQVETVSQPTNSAPMARPVPAPQPAKAIIISPESRVSDLIDAVPSTQRLLATAGLSALSLPGHLDHVRARGVTLGIACRNHGLDIDELILQLESHFRENGFVIRNSVPAPGANGDNGHINGARLIGDVIKSHPAAKPVFQKYFGSGCFDCPGQAFESIEMACRMHGVESGKFLSELNEAVA